MKQGGCALIKRNDVARIKMPFPDISSDLALSSSVMKHYWDESPDLNRNPFKRKTRIDCDKTFVTSFVTYDDKLKTTTRPDVCEDVMRHIDSELLCDGYITNYINENELLSLNSLIHKIK